MTDARESSLGDSRPWTPGPWEVDPEEFHDVSGSSRWIGPDADHGVFVLYPTRPDAALIALAPEMAEAILAWNDGNSDGYANGTPDAVADALDHVAVKLLSIGRES